MLINSLQFLNSTEVPMQVTFSSSHNQRQRQLREKKLRIESDWSSTRPLIGHMRYDRSIQIESK